MPPSSASLRLLVQATRDSNPILTNAVFSLTPVRRDAFFTNVSSMLSVVLMHTNMHYLCISVNSLFEANARPKLLRLPQRG